MFRPLPGNSAQSVNFLLSKVSHREHVLNQGHNPLPPSDDTGLPPNCGGPKRASARAAGSDGMRCWAQDNHNMDAHPRVLEGLVRDTE